MLTTFRSIEHSGCCAQADSTGAIPVRHEGQGVRTFTHTYTYLLRFLVYAEFVYLPFCSSAYLGEMYTYSLGDLLNPVYTLSIHTILPPLYLLVI